MAEFNTGIIDIYLPVVYGENTSTQVEKYGEMRIKRNITSSSYYQYSVSYTCTLLKTNADLPATETPVRVNIYNYTDDIEFEGSSIFKTYIDSFNVSVVSRKQANLDGYGGLYDTRITIDSDLFCNADGNKAIAEYTDTFELNTLTSRAVKLIGATDFTDEDNPTITLQPNTRQGSYVSKVQAVISLSEGSNDIVRDLNVNETRTAYTFILTDEERALIRQAITQGTSKQIKYIIINTPNTDYELAKYFTVYNSTMMRTVYLLDALPVLSPELTVLDSTTKELTGADDTFIKYYSYASYSINAEVGKGASITSQQVSCGEQTNTAASGSIGNVESGIFTFSATDNRGNTTNVVIEKPLVEYVKLTCNQKVDIELSGETEAKVTLTITGNYFNDSFGAVDNELILEIRHTQNDGTMGDWVRLTDGLIPYFNGNTYSLNFTISGLEHYDMPYIFQCRALDKISTVETEEYQTRVTPLFDWSAEDFNFNIPVSIQGGAVSGSFTLSDTTTEGIVELSDVISNYKYIEIYYTDNNSRGYGYTKIPIVSDNTITVDLSIVEASSATTTYIRRTAYLCNGNKLTPVTSSAGYVFVGNAVSHTTGTNYLRIIRVVGVK